MRDLRFWRSESPPPEVPATCRLTMTLAGYLTLGAARIFEWWEVEPLWVAAPVRPLQSPRETQPFNGARRPHGRPPILEPPVRAGM